MARQKKTYAMLTPERLFQIEQEILVRHATRIVVGLPSDSPEEKEEAEEQQPAPMEVVDPEDDKAEALAPGFNMEDA